MVLKPLSLLSVHISEYPYPSQRPVELAVRASHRLLTPDRRFDVADLWPNSSRNRRVRRKMSDQQRRLAV